MSSKPTRINLAETDHSVADLVDLFNRLFESVENTRLVRGGAEPVYLPASKDCHYHQVVFAHGFFSSALHEVAHWCLAGRERRLQLDYGYWYAPDGRDQQQQIEFEHVEIKPQALEWILSRSCGKRFRVSTDNLNGTESDSMPFKIAGYQKVQGYCREGLRVRAKVLCEQLCMFYHTQGCIRAVSLSIDEL